VLGFGGAVLSGGPSATFFLRKRRRALGAMNKEQRHHFSELGEKVRDLRGYL
jgi:hypothetical protein